VVLLVNQQRQALEAAVAADAAEVESFTNKCYLYLVQLQSLLVLVELETDQCLTQALRAVRAFAS
jgi:hypothetical protein